MEGGHLAGYGVGVLSVGDGPSQPVVQELALALVHIVG